MDTYEIIAIQIVWCIVYAFVIIQTEYPIRHRIAYSILTILSATYFYGKDSWVVFLGASISLVVVDAIVAQDAKEIRYSIGILAFALLVCFIVKIA